MTTREQLEVEAAELYPEPERDLEEAVRSNLESYGEGARAAHVRAKTVTAEQIEAATFEFALQTKVPYGRMPSHHRYYWRQITVEAFRAAGLLIEGQDDD